MSQSHVEVWALWERPAVAQLPPSRVIVGICARPPCRPHFLRSLFSQSLSHSGLPDGSRHPRAPIRRKLISTHLIQARRVHLLLQTHPDQYPPDTGLLLPYVDGDILVASPPIGQ